MDNNARARAIRQQADSEFLAGLDRLSSTGSTPETRASATRMAVRFRTFWINRGLSGDPMPDDIKLWFHTK